MLDLIGNHIVGFLMMRLIIAKKLPELTAMAELISATSKRFLTNDKLIGLKKKLISCFSWFCMFMVNS